MIYITRRERFNAAHRLFRAELNDAENSRIYGKCSNPNWHGHNYELYITVKGEIQEKAGYVINLKDLSKIIKEHVTDKLDHKNLNLEVDFLKDMIPTSENLAVAIWGILAPLIRAKGAELHKIRVVETENNSVEYYG